MNRQIILAFLLAVGSTAFATETEITTAESNRTEQQPTEQQIVDSGSTVETPTNTKRTFAQKVKGKVSGYFIRKDKKRTALNLFTKAVATITLLTSLKYDYQYFNLKKTIKKQNLFMIYAQASTLLSALELLNC